MAQPPLLDAALLGIGVLLHRSDAARDVTRSSRHELEVVDTRGTKLGGDGVGRDLGYADGPRDSRHHGGGPPGGAQVSLFFVFSLDHGEALHAICVNARREGRGHALRTRCHALTEALLLHVVLGDVLVVTGSVLARCARGIGTLRVLVILPYLGLVARGALSLLGTHVARRAGLTGHRVFVPLVRVLGELVCLARGVSPTREGARKGVGTKCDKDAARKAHAQGAGGLGVNA